MENKKIDFCYITILVILCISLIFSSLYIGSYLRNNVQVINLIFSIVSIICLIFNFMKKKEIRFSKLDISVSILCFSSFIPLMFKTYSSLQDTIEYALWYMSAFNIYLIIKLLGIGSNAKILNLIVNITILNSLIFIIFGIDDMTFKVLLLIREYLEGIIDYNSSSLRMDSLFEYPNAFAACIAFSLILTISYYFKSKNFYKKIIYNYILFLQFFAIYSSGSRLALIVLVFIAILQCILDYKNIKLKEILFIVVFDTVFSFLLVNKYLECLEYERYKEALFFILKYSFANIISFTIIYFILKKIYNKLINNINIKLNKKYLYMLFVVVTIIIITIIFFILKSTSPLILDKNNDVNKIRSTRVISHIEPNTNYDFRFNINTYSQDKFCKFYIYIKQYDKDEFLINEEKILLKDYNGEKQVNINTLGETKIIKLEFSNNNVGKKVKVVVNSLKINGKKYPLNYKYLPIGIVNRLTKEVMNTKSTWLRFYYIKDAIKVIKKNIIFGYGGNGWDYNYENIKSYNYISRDVHSHPLQIFIQNGIIGFISYIFILYYLIKIIISLYKGKISKNNNAYIFCISFIIIHSFLDFDMSFFYNLIMAFMYIAIISNIYSEKLNLEVKLKISKKIISYLLIIIEIFILVINARIFTAKLIYKNIITTRDTNNININNIETISKAIAIDPYNMEYRKKYIDEYTLNLVNDSYKFSLEDYNLINKNLNIYLSNSKRNSIYIVPYKQKLYEYCENINYNNVDENVKIILTLINMLENYNEKSVMKEEINYSKLYDILLDDSIKFDNSNLNKLLERVQKLVKK